MRKISRLNYFRIMFFILMLSPLMLHGQTVSPRSGSTVQELSEINITFSSDVVLQNIDGISIGLGNQYLPPWDKPGEYGFTVTTQGNQATIKLDNPYSNLYNFEQWGTLFCEEGTFLVGGSPSSEIGAEWTFSPSKATIPEPVISPARGSVNLSLSEITIEWPGCGVEIVGNEWDLEEVKFGIQGSNYSHANIASIETAGDAGSLGKSKVVIKVQNSKDGNKPFTEKGTYVLNLEQGVVKINATDGSAMFPGDEFTFFISDYMVSPKNMSKITNFDGLTIGGGNIEIKDPSLIKLYLGYYDGMGESVPPADLSPLASGTNVKETTLDGVPAMNVSFGLNEPLYNGAYSIYIPANAILSDGKGINEGNSLYVTFTIEGNMKPLPEWTAEPVPGKVTSLSTVNIAWGKKRPASNALENFYGDFLTLTNDAGYVPVTLELPNGTKNQLMGMVRIVTDNNGDVDQAEKLGAYLYIMLGNSYSADGVYTLTIPAGSFTVDVDNHNHVPVENTVITYVIGDGNVTDPVPQAKEIHLAFAAEGTDIGSNTISSRNDPLMERQTDGSYVYEYELNAKSPKNFGFMMYFAEGYNYMSIGKAQREGSSYGADEQITLPNVPGEKAEYTFTDLGQYSVGFAGYGMQSTFTFTNPGGFAEGTAWLKLSADLKTLEVFVTSNEVEEPEPVEGELKLEDENFYPQANVPYYYTPSQDGILTVKAMEGGDFTITSMMGGLYDANGKLMTPIKTDGDISDVYIFDFSYVDYELKAGNQYYFQWGKNSDEDEYALYASFGDGTTGPQINYITFDFTGAEDAYQHIQFRNLASDTPEEPIALPGNPYELVLTPSGFGVQLNAVEGYAITSVTADKEGEFQILPPSTDDSEDNPLAIQWIIMGSPNCGGTTFTVEVEQTEVTEGILLLEDENFYPKADIPYYYTPNVDGTLTIKAMEGGEFTTTTMAGGLYSANGRLMTPSKTDGSISGEYIFDFTYVDYDVKAGNQYYFQWGKNSTEDDYALYAEFTVGSVGPGPDVQLPNLIANPENGSTVQWFTGIAMRWGTSRLTMVNDKGFKVTHNGVDITKDPRFDFIMQTIEYDPDEKTSWEDVQLQIEATGIYPMSEEGTYVFTVYPGVVTINVDGKQVPNPQVELTYYIGKQGPAAQLPEPTVNPANNSKLDKLENVTLRWNGYDVHQIGDGEGGMLKDITYTVNGGSPKVIDVEYQGNESVAFEGYYPTLVLPINAKESGKYVITIPAGALYVANENAGSLENKEVVLTYDVTLTETPPAVLMTGAAIDPRDGTRLDNMGNVMIAWTQYRLAINPPVGKDYVDLPLDGVHIYINGEENTTWMNMMGASLRAVNTKGSNEGGGGPASEFDVAEILLCPGDAAFHWSGTVNIVLPEGLVKSTTGAISPAFDLTYYVGGKNVVSPAIFTPEDGAKFLPGEAVVYAAWNGYSVTAINGGLTVNTINEEGDVSGSTSISNSKLSIEEGKLRIDLTSLPVGSYQMWLQQGAVNLGDNAVNADAPYAFSIALPEPEGPEATDIDPAINIADGKITISWDGNEIELTDDFNLTIIDNTTGEEVNIWDGVVSVDENGNLVIDLEELELPDGDYTLTLAEGSVNIDKDGTITYNNEVTYDFKTSAIGMYTADGTGYWRVFNLSGVNVLNTDKEEDLQRLAPGIYIINGKKLVVK